MRRFPSVFLFATLLMSLLISLGRAEAQSATGLEIEMKALVELLSEDLPSTREPISQRARIDPARDYVLIVERTAGEGRRVQTDLATLNLAYVMRARLGRASGDRLPVTVLAQAAGIAISDGEGKTTYRDEFDVYAANVEQARAIEAAFARTLPLAKAAFERQSALPVDEAGLQDFLSSSVTTVSAGQRDLLQTLTFAADGTAEYTRSGAANRELTTVTHFVLADLQPLANQVVARSGYLELRLEPRNGREYVEQLEGGRRRYQREVTLQFADVATAQLAREAFAKLIPLAEERAKQGSAGLTSVERAAAQLSAALATTPTEESTQVFALSGCAAQLTREQRSRTTTVEAARFDFSDIDPNKIEVRPRGEELQLSLTTRGNERLIQRAKDELPAGYGDDVVLAITGPAAAAGARWAAIYLAENCRRDTTPIAFSAALALANVTRFATGEDEQMLAATGNDKCIYLLTRTERSGSRSTEKSYTFNLGDLDTRAVQMKVSGVEVSLIYGTRRGEKVIEELAADGDRRFGDEIILRFVTVEDARQFRAAARREIDNCQR